MRVLLGLAILTLLVIGVAGCGGQGVEYDSAKAVTVSTKEAVDVPAAPLGGGGGTRKKGYAPPSGGGATP